MFRVLFFIIILMSNKIHAMSLEFSYGEVLFRNVLHMKAPSKYFPLVMKICVKISCGKYKNEHASINRLRLNVNIHFYDSCKSILLDMGRH